MWTRRNFLEKGLKASFSSLLLSWGGMISTSWAKAKRLLPAGFPKGKIIQMHPVDIDSQNLEIDPLDKFGTMGPTDILIDLKTYRLKIAGRVERPQAPR